MKKKYEVGGDDLDTYWYIFTGYTVSEVLQKIWSDSFYKDEFVFRKYPYVHIEENKRWFALDKITVYLSKVPIDSAPMYSIREFTLK